MIRRPVGGVALVDTNGWRNVDANDACVRAEVVAPEAQASTRVDANLSARRRGRGHTQHIGGDG
eukprot:scaffold108749_cov105-Phaeocystis_antarctica.AAC.2